MASMYTVIAKNVELTAYTVKGLGITVPAEGQIILSDLFKFDRLAAEDDLRDAVAAEDLVINDGTSDLSTAAGVAFLKLGKSDDVAAAQATADGAVTDAATAQSTADGAVTDAATAQSTADGAVTDAATAQSTADGAVTDAATAQSTIDGHIDGSANKHDASEIDVEGASYDNISVGSLEAALGEIDAAITAAAGSGNDLDGSYSLGRTINADEGPVKIITTGTQAGLELTPSATLPSTVLGGGQFHVDSATGMLFMYDATRSKWLSVARLSMAFGKEGKAKNLYLGYYGSDFASLSSGILPPRKLTITAITARLDVAGTADFIVCSNVGGADTDELTLSLSSALLGINAAANVNIEVNEAIRCRMESASKVEDPMVYIEYAWRL